ncbi:GAF domain-containing protein [Mesorhizobium sp. CU2]|uniref:HWE histidine kinase domain-containing protein n=1 Tax=unclassified Mesorhizobium TaxID=325217 RepID=UPI0011273A2F|nr:MULTISPECIES: HWE histidine kinase domain-containing protein [unclassified Mesorhizobium]TPN80712.1 GAF domain-containing protein [Mesorhizobium sp. CU3]TPO10188.1 GAF domain-containing protein [Mesorhizobium sp. CU2]
MLDKPAVDLTNCDREPIHIPGSIQSHGCLIACDTNAGVCLRHSANANAMLGCEGEINGSKLEEIVGDKLAHDLRNTLATAGAGSRPALLFGMRLPSGNAFDIAIHRYKSTSIIEFEPSSDDVEQPLVLARSLIGRLGDIEDIDRLIQQSARLIRGLLGYDRVMVYRFEADGAGKVISEVKRADLESFLGQYFPASDIPKQARTLYLRNTIRIIADASDKRVPILPELDISGEPLDLSFAHLRSVSPIHCEYLRNMGVAASMSISIIVDGELWGLIACHHYSPRNLPMARRVAAEMFGEFFSLHLQALKQKATLDAATRARQAIDGFLQLASRSTDIRQLLRDNLADLARLMPCDGVGLWIGDEWTSVGSTPPASYAAELSRFVGSMADGKVWATHALSQRLADAEDFSASASGVLAIPLSQRPRDYLFFFRKELVQTLDWAGNPDKVYEFGPLGDRLTPRKSFAIWKETVRLQSQPWTDADREIAEAARIALVETLLRHSELVSEERDRADVRQRMLNEELNHRVKNILAVIKSLVGHPIQEGRSLSDYVEALKGRIQALSFAHDQVVRGDGGGSLSDLLGAELSPYRTPTTTVEMGGREIWLDARAFSVMALVLHEMSTNAAKYGALSRVGGKVEIKWEVLKNGNCEISWTETGGPEVSPPMRMGFGTALLDRSIPYDLGGSSEVLYEREGVCARFVLPARHISIPSDAMKKEAHPGDHDVGHVSGFDSDMRVLLVEDQMLIAMDAENMLADIGFANVTVAASAREAFEKLRLQPPQLAILDINLGDGTSLEIAEELSRLRIPFVFATGYGDKNLIGDAFAEATVVRKPYNADALRRAIATALKG